MFVRFSYPAGKWPTRKYRINPLAVVSLGSFNKHKWPIFIACAPGLELVLENELRELRLMGNLRRMDGGIEFLGTARELYLANLWSQIASRVLVRVGEFTVKDFHLLVKLTEELPWHCYLKPNCKISIRVTCKESKLYHSVGVSERVFSGICNAFKKGFPGSSVVLIPLEEVEKMASPSDITVNIFRY
eukprot:TRINITY_DN1250_c0_g2_i24.p1 TRINITY_DN1250_c0_g2~~TRINITY_DN1250_c0_g2_i24.p1  ORF type:complete len:188 (+),score=16.80 TRINITY_DN1250_c0_g2_i24:103-666(+)